MYDSAFPRLLRELRPHVEASKVNRYLRRCAGIALRRAGRRRKMFPRHRLPFRGKELGRRATRRIGEVRLVRLHSVPCVRHQVVIRLHVLRACAVDVPAEIVDERVHVKVRVERRHRPGIVRKT